MGGWLNGRAPRLHRGGYRFESYTAHHYPSAFPKVQQTGKVACNANLMPGRCCNVLEMVIIYARKFPVGGVWDPLRLAQVLPDGTLKTISEKIGIS